MDYTWLQHAATPNKPKTTIPKRLKLELENMGRKIKAANTDVVIQRFRHKLLGTGPSIEEVPLLFSSVLRTVVSEQVAEERKRMLDRPLSLVSRVIQSLHRTNRVGVMNDIESAPADVISPDEEVMDHDHDRNDFKLSSSNPGKFVCLLVLLL